jgi:hypothetical protein
MIKGFQRLKSLKALNLQDKNGGGDGSRTRGTAYKINNLQDSGKGLAKKIVVTSRGNDRFFGLSPPAKLPLVSNNYPVISAHYGDMSPVRSHEHMKSNGKYANYINWLQHWKETA